jgi:hypothetical protein
VTNRAAAVEGGAAVRAGEAAGFCGDGTHAGIMDLRLPREKSSWHGGEPRLC